MLTKPAGVFLQMLGGAILIIGVLLMVASGGLGAVRRADLAWRNGGDIRMEVESGREGHHGEWRPTGRICRLHA